MGRKRKQKKGYILKSDFCKKHDIKVSEFNKTLSEKGFLVYQLISYEISGKGKKYAYGICHSGDSRILPLHGSYQQGVFQYDEKFLEEIFEIT
jgi:hypothetical protein